MSFINGWQRYLIICFLPLFIFFKPAYAADIELLVKEPFINVHTGPSSLHPIFYVVTKNEKIKIILQKTQWIKIETVNGKLGWVNQKDIKKTLFSNGDSIQFNEVDFDEYSKRRIEMGIQAGDIKNSPSLSLTVGYLFNETFMTQLSLGKSIGKLSTISIVTVDALMMPFPKLSYSPYFALGVGNARLNPHTTLINPKTTSSSVAKIAVGIRKYIGERFVLRLELVDYTLFSADVDADSNDEVTEWKVGFSTFF